MTLNITRDQAKSVGARLESLSTSLTPKERKALLAILVAAGLAVPGVDPTVFPSKGDLTEVLVAIRDQVKQCEDSETVLIAAEQDGC
jgi:hypothetical protein